MSKKGRPSRFNEALAATILALAERGSTDEQISGNLGIPLRTLNNWKGRHPDFKHALTDAKAVADELVEATLFQLALGYRHPAVKIVYDRDAQKFVSHGYMEMLAPDAAACIFWLRNRKPADWRSNPPEADDGPEDGEVIDAEWKVEIIGEKPATMNELRDAASRYYDRKPPPLKIAGNDGQS